MRKTWFTPEMYETLNPRSAPTSFDVHIWGADGSSKAQRVAAAIEQKTNWQRSHAGNGLTRSLNALLARQAYPLGARNVLARVFMATRRFSLYTPKMDARKLIERVEQDNELDRHVHTVMEVYRAGFRSSAFERDFLRSEAGRELCDYVGFVEHDSQMYRRDDLPECMYCEECVFPEDEVQVIDSYGDESAAHYRCAVDEAHRCAVSGAFFESDDDFVTLQDTDDYVARDHCLARGLIHCHYDEDDGDDVYTRHPHGRLVGYHNAPRPWEGDDDIPNGYIGVELEVGFADGADGRSEFLRQYVRADGRFKELPFSCERDGSLGSVPGGMEIISDPLELRSGYQKRAAPWRKLLRDLYKAGGEGWTHRHAAGLHVNLCVRDESDESVFKYAAFIGNAEAMSKFIAGRKSIYGTEQGYIKVPRRMILPDDAIGLGLQQVFRGGKYAAVSRRNDKCLETRIFGSNIRYEGFMACVEYCVAVMAFVRPLHRLDVLSPTISAEFRQWLGTMTATYPNLAARLGVIAHGFGTAFPSDQRVVPVLAAA